MKSSWFLTILMAILSALLIYRTFDDVELLKATCIILATLLIAAMCKANYIKDKYDAFVSNPAQEKQE